MPGASAGTPNSFLVFMVCWIAMGIASWIFYSKASYQTKKSLHPFLTVAYGVVFLGFAEWLMQGKLPLFFVVAVIVIMFLIYRLTRFCPQCGATIYSLGLQRSNFCPKCGAALQ
jgi:ribosomal protein S27AE